MGPRPDAFLQRLRNFIRSSCIFVLSQHVQDPWFLSASDVQRERAVETLLSLLQTFRDNMLLTVGGVSSKSPQSLWLFWSKSLLIIIQRITYGFFVSFNILSGACRSSGF